MAWTDGALNVRLVTLANWQVIVVDAVFWLIVQGGTGWLFHHLPPRWFDHDTRITRPRRIEGDGRLYVEWLRIKVWKGWLPEAGDLFTGGFDKGSLPPGSHRSRAHLAAYVRESRRAEIAHWMMVLPTPLTVLWNPWYAAVWMPIYAIVVNGPCISSMRYNRLRMVRLLAKPGLDD